MNPLTPQKIDVPPYMTMGAVFYHITQKEHAENIKTKGIDPDIKGKVNALGFGFYTVRELANVWQWMHFEDDTDPKTLSDKFSVIEIEIVTVPTKVWNGRSDDAEVIVAQTDIVWTKSGIKNNLIKVKGEITGNDMYSDKSFKTWHAENFTDDS